MIGDGSEDGDCDEVICMIVCCEAVRSAIPATAWLLVSLSIVPGTAAVAAVKASDRNQVFS